MFFYSFGVYNRTKKISLCIEWVHEFYSQFFAQLVNDEIGNSVLFFSVLVTEADYSNDEEAINVHLNAVLIRQSKIDAAMDLMAGNKCVTVLPTGHIKLSTDKVNLEIHVSCCFLLIVASK